MGAGGRTHINGSSSSTTIPSRGGEVADALIEGCSGYLQSDGYQAYEVRVSARPRHCGCFAHARRRFFEALKALPNAQRKQASAAAHEAVRRIDALYLIERQIKDLSDDERTRIRSEKPCRSSHPCTRGRAK